MFATVPSTSFAFPPAREPASTSPDPWASERYQPSDPLAFITLIRKHHQAIFHLIHALLRDEVAAEKITQQVFARARRRLERSHHSAPVVEWLYYASFRFVRMHHRKTGSTRIRRRVSATTHQHANGDLHTLVRVIVRHPGKLEPRDRELLALRTVLGMSLANIGQLLRMHPYEVANRLAWAHERFAKLGEQLPLVAEVPAVDPEKTASLELSA